jgi:acyl-CoA thioesterase I
MTFFLKTFFSVTKGSCWNAGFTLGMRYGIAVLWVVFGFVALPPALAQNPKTVATNNAAPNLLILGDSLSAEYGLPRGKGWVALLEQRLVQQKLQWQVVNSSISGETTAGGATRLPALLKQHKPKVVVIELGANDALRGLDLRSTQSNLFGMTKAAQAQGAKVVLLGMNMPPNYGRSYSESFNKLFADVAMQTKAGLVPFFLQGFAEDLLYFQPDRIHPTVAAQPKMLDNVWPVLNPLLLTK